MALRNLANKSVFFSGRTTTGANFAPRTQNEKDSKNIGETAASWTTRGKVGLLGKKFLIFKKFETVKKRIKFIDRPSSNIYLQ